MLYIFLFIGIFLGWGLFFSFFPKTNNGQIAKWAFTIFVVISFLREMLEENLEVIFILFFIIPIFLSILFYPLFFNLVRRLVDRLVNKISQGKK
jgi:hypothetical protein